MSDFALEGYAPQGPPRAPGGKLARPRHSATLLLVRRDGDGVRLLMGRRNSGHGFMPDAWVFPGGRVDRADYRAPHGHDLKPDAAATLERHVGPVRGRALAMAAVRETFEETGLLLATPATPRPGAGPWREFLAQGALADLSALDILGRAVTPPSIARRFDTWFLTADAGRLLSLERQPDCGELEEIAWVDLAAAEGLNLPRITRFMLGELSARMADPGRPRPYMRTLHGRHTRANL